MWWVAVPMAGVMAMASWLRSLPRSSILAECIVHQMSGLHCPGCGGLRALWDLIHGDALSAARNNLLILLLGPAWIFIYMRNAARCGRPWRHATRNDLIASTAIASVTMIAIFAFTIVRNQPWGEFLRPN